MTIRFIKNFTDPFAANTKRIKRTCQRRLKDYLKNPTLARAIAFDVAAEEHQIAVLREGAAADLAAKGWKL